MVLPSFSQCVCVCMTSGWCRVLPLQVVGYEAVVKQVCQLVCPTTASQCTGMLLTGLPGCGKSALAEAVAECSGRAVFRVDPTSLFRRSQVWRGCTFAVWLGRIAHGGPCVCVFHWQGAGEAVLRHVFERARSKAPSVVVIHDVDVLGMLLQQQGVGAHSSLPSSLTTLSFQSQHRCRTRAWCSIVSPRGCWLAWMRFVNMAGVWLQLVLLMTAAAGGCPA